MYLKLYIVLAFFCCSGRCVPTGSNAGTLVDQDLVNFLLQATREMAANNAGAPNPTSQQQQQQQQPQQQNQQQQQQQQPQQQNQQQQQQQQPQQQQNQQQQQQQPQQQNQQQQQQPYYLVYRYQQPQLNTYQQQILNYLWKMYLRNAYRLRGGSVDGRDASFVTPLGTVSIDGNDVSYDSW